MSKKKLRRKEKGRARQVVRKRKSSGGLFALILLGFACAAAGTIFAYRFLGRQDGFIFAGKLPYEVTLEKDLIGGGVPGKEVLETARRKGFRSVIDLRLSEEGTSPEKGLAEQYGLKYYHIPVRSDDLTRAQLEHLHAILGQAEARPAILFCSSGKRAALLWAVYRELYKSL